MLTIGPKELSDWLRQTDKPQPILLDVREQWELDTCSITGNTHIPMGQIQERAIELDKTKPIVCICHHGMRSMRVAQFLEHEGFENIYNLSGGIHCWSIDVDPNCPTY